MVQCKQWEKRNPGDNSREENEKRQVEAKISHPVTNVKRDTRRKLHS
jgi:hypothetical protein